MFGLNGIHLLIVIGVIVLLFGATRLPALARSVGQSMKIFRQEIKSDTDDKTESAEPPVVDDKK